MNARALDNRNYVNEKMKCFSPQPSTLQAKATTIADTTFPSRLPQKKQAVKCTSMRPTVEAHDNHRPPTHMHDIKVLDQFIQLRVLGLSVPKIAKKLGVPASTLY